MKVYLAEVFSDASYPLQGIKVEGGSFGMAANNAYKEYKKRHKGQRIKEITVRLTELGQQVKND